MEAADQITKLTKILMPFALQRQQTVIRDGIQFVHYTGAEAAMNILRSGEVWMRNVSCMNDFREVQHGVDCLIAAYKGEGGKSFQAALNGVYAEITKEIEELFNAWVEQFKWNTYLACVSEHNKEENETGRLSMWRAYGDATGVAIVMHNTRFISPVNHLKVYASPVAYMNDDGIGEQLTSIGENVQQERDFLASLSREQIKNVIFWILRFAAISTKHPGFKEEREWRVVYTPSLDKSEHVAHAIVSVHGAPQPIYKIPVRDDPAKGLVGIGIPSLVDRIIIGPTRYPVAVRDAFVELLRDAGVEGAEQKVWVSNIPLRT